MNMPFKLLCSTCALVLSGHAAAATTWTLSGTPTAGVTVGAYANTGNASGLNGSQNAANNGALQTIRSATLNSYSGGIGITNADSCTGSSNACNNNDRNEGSDPEHAIDNQQRYDMALLTFSAPVQLTAMKLGWMSNDSDMTVMAYNGSGAPNTMTSTSPNFVGVRYGDLMSKGWAAIGHYANVGTAAPMAINAIGVVSSYWLIGAYNPLALNPLANPAGPTSFSSSSFDYVKLASVTGFVPQVPEPSSIALMGLALTGMLVLRKRAQA